MLKEKISLIGGLMFVVGAAGMAEAVTGEGSFTVATIVFVVGIACSMIGYAEIGRGR